MLLQRSPWCQTPGSVPTAVDRQPLTVGDRAPGLRSPCTGDKMLTLVASALAWWRLHCTTPHALRAESRGLGGCMGCVRNKAQKIHSLLDLPAQLPWLGCHVIPARMTRSAGSCWPRPGLTDAPDFGRRTPDHRPGLHRLRDLWAVQGGCATPQLRRPAGLSPDLGRGRRNRRRVDGTAAPGPRQHRSGRRLTSGGRR